MTEEEMKALLDTLDWDATLGGVIDGGHFTFESPVGLRSSFSLNRARSWLRNLGELGPQ